MRKLRVLGTGGLFALLVAAAAAQFTGPTPLAWRWAHTTSVPPLGAPVVQGDTVFVAVGNRMFALDRETGNQKWRYPLVEGLPGYFRAGLVLVDGMLIGAADNALIYAVDAATGQAKWQHPTAVPVIGQPVATGKFVVFQRSDNSLMALTAADGQKAWPGEFKVFDGINGGLGVHGDNLIYMTQAGEMICLSANTQRTLWKKRFSVIFNDSVPVVFGDNVYLNSGTWVAALSALTGNVRWQQNVGEQLAFSPAVSPSGVFVSTVEGDAFLFDTATGRPKWRQPVSLGSTPIVRPSNVDALFLAPTGNGALNVVDPIKAEVIWSFLVRPQVAGATQTTTPGGGNNRGGPSSGRGSGGTSAETSTPILAIPASGPAVLYGKTLFVLCQDGSLLAFDPEHGVDKTGPSIKMAWPTPGDQVSGQPPLELIFKIDDEATGVSDKTIKITIDGQELEYEFGRDGYAVARISLLGKNKPLTNGRKVVKVSASDWMGNVSSEEFSLTIDNNLRPLQRTPGGQTGPGQPGRPGGRGGGGGVGGIG